MVMAGGVLAMAGCSELRPPTDDELARGYILLLPGIGSHGFHMAPMITGLREGGVNRAIDLDVWGKRPFGSMVNLTNYEANHKESLRLAGKVEEYRRAHPDAPITIVGYSGGAGMAVFTAEALPEDVALDRIVLIGAALSPHYDLSKAISRCSRGVVSIYSELDWATLGAGTEMLGTMDRQKTASAGYIGFRNPNDQLLARNGLTQIPWVPAWRKLGHAGNHTGYLSKWWARDVLAPQLKLAAAAAASAPARR